MTALAHTVAPVARRSTRALQEEIGRRIDEAWEAAGYESRSAMLRATGIRDQNQAHQWAKGSVLPRVDGLIAIAEACRISLDWLCRGTEETPPAYLEWLDSSDGQTATDEARTFLRSLPVRGYKATATFYQLAHAAWQIGLHREGSPDEIVQAARAKERLKSDPRVGKKPDSKDGS